MGGRLREAYKILLEYVLIGIDGRIILKFIGFNCLAIMPGSCVHSIEFRAHKRWGISRPAERLSVSQWSLWSVELANKKAMSLMFVCIIRIFRV
jgi:hypothetical protein